MSKEKMVTVDTAFQVFDPDGRPNDYIGKPTKVILPGEPIAYRIVKEAVEAGRVNIVDTIGTPSRPAPKADKFEVVGEV